MNDLAAEYGIRVHRAASKAAKRLSQSAPKSSTNRKEVARRSRCTRKRSTAPWRTSRATTPDAARVARTARRVPTASPKTPSAAAKGVKRRELHIYVLRRDGLRVADAASEDDKARRNFQRFLKSLCNARDNYSMEVRSDAFESAKSHFFDTSSWGAFCDVTLTLKQARQPDSGGWVKIDDYQCRQAFRHFMNLLNRAVYGAAFRRYGKRLRVLPVLEKGEVRARALRSWDRGTSGRWHIHCAIELPSHFDGIGLENLICDCWAKVEWGYGRILVRDGANAGWINYMLKDRQKSEFDGFVDCIVIESLHNRVLQRQQERRKDTSRKAT